MSKTEDSSKAIAKAKEKTAKRQTVKEAPPELKRWKVAFLLSIFLGFLGADRFYIGRTRSAIIKLLTLGRSGAWWISDVILIASEWRKDAWGRPLKH
jgi:hypothetical protein